MSRSSKFTLAVRRQTGFGGAIMAKVNEKWREGKETDRQRSLASKASGSAIGFFVFGFFFFLIPMLLRLLVNLALLLYCLVMGIMWGIGASFDAIFLRRSAPMPGGMANRARK